MKSKIKIENVHCPNCAKNLEAQIVKYASVKSANFDFVKSTLYFESDNVEKSVDMIVKITKHLDPNAKVITNKTDNKKSDKIKTVINFVTLGLGIILGVLCFVLTLPQYLFWPMFVLSLLLLGYKTYIKAVKLIFKGVIDENLLLTISVVGASVLGQYMEAVMVIGLYSIGKILEGLAVDKSRKSIEKLTQLQPEYAVKLEDGVEQKVLPHQVNVGDIIVVKPGEKIALDGIVINGSSSLNTQSLTGESMPVLVKENSEVLSGSIVIDGVLQIKVTTAYDESTVNKILNLIENSSDKKSKTETTISKVARWYTLGVIILAILTFFIVWAVTKDISVSVYRGLIFLVVSCPCAFAISVPLSYFSGLGNASKHGILIKGSNYLDTCGKLKTVAFDKTGTLTTGKFVIEDIICLTQDYTQQDILYLASLGEQNSLHPIAKSIVSYNKKELCAIEEFKEVAGEGVYFTFNNDKYFIGRKSENAREVNVELYQNNGLIGKIILSDQIKKSSFNAIESLNKMGINTVMLSGDNTLTAKNVAEKLNIKNCYGQMLPQDKFNWIQQNKSKNKIGYVGDGINDSPSLVVADIGISMGVNGSGASIEASDIVLVDDNPEKVATAIKISKHTLKIVWQNIIFSAVIKVAFLTLGALGITGMLFAVFADVGVTLLAVLNSMRALFYKPNKRKIRNKK